MRAFAFYGALLSVCFFAGPGAAQCVPASVNGVDWSDSFDSYDAPSGIAGQGAWELWDLNAPNALVVPFDGAGNALKIGGNGVNSDIVRVFCDLTADPPYEVASVTVRAWQYIPSTMEGLASFNLLNTYEHGGGFFGDGWDVSTQLAFIATSGTVCDFGTHSTVQVCGGLGPGGQPWGHEGSGSHDILVTDAWALIEVEIDFETNTHRIKYDGIDLFGSDIWAATPTSDPPGQSKVALECIDLFTDGGVLGAVNDHWYDDFSVDLPGAGILLIRGDCDGNGEFNGLVDGLRALNFQFNPMSTPPPPCLSACDADGDQVFNGLNDALYVLAHQFQDGPPPLAPYPDCGADPNGLAALGCNNAPLCP